MAYKMKGSSDADPLYYTAWLYSYNKIYSLADIMLSILRIFDTDDIDRINYHSQKAFNFQWPSISYDSFSGDLEKLFQAKKNKWEDLTNNRNNSRQQIS